MLFSLEQHLPLLRVMVQFNSWRSHGRFIACVLQGILISHQIQGASPKVTKALAQGVFLNVMLAGSSCVWARCYRHSKPRGDVQLQGWILV